MAKDSQNILNTFMSHSEEDMPDEMELKVFNLLTRSSKPRPIQEVADHIGRDYDYTLNYLRRKGERRRIRFHDLDDGTQAVELAPVSQPHH